MCSIPTMTNEVVFGYTFIGFPNVFQDPDEGGPNEGRLQLQGSVQERRGADSRISAAAAKWPASAVQGGFEVGGPSHGLYANKYMPSFSDTLLEDLGQAHAEGGLLLREHPQLRSRPATHTKGQLIVQRRATPTRSATRTRDMMLGNLNSYTETSFNRINDISYRHLRRLRAGFVEGVAALTLELGIRITQFPPWSDNLGFGFSVFDYSKYSPSCTPTALLRLPVEQARSVGAAGRLPDPAAVFPAALRHGLRPRASNTVLRGGWGRYYYHSGQFTTGLNVSAGMQTVTLEQQPGHRRQYRRCWRASSTR